MLLWDVSIVILYVWSLGGRGALLREHCMISVSIFSGGMAPGSENEVRIFND